LGNARACGAGRATGTATRAFFILVPAIYTILKKHSLSGVAADGHSYVHLIMERKYQAFVTCCHARCSICLQTMLSISPLAKWETLSRRAFAHYPLILQQFEKMYYA
jgi:hypothetical protein